MKAEESLALISYRLERSREALRAAEIMFENSMLTFSMNRVYYAMFYAVQALLVSRKVSFSKHGQVKAYFNREMIKTGIFPTEMGRLYNKAFELSRAMVSFHFSCGRARLICHPRASIICQFSSNRGQVNLPLLFS
jgi:uncharacterized protein (UPF0332 family)